MRRKAKVNSWDSYDWLDYIVGWWSQTERHIDKVKCYVAKVKVTEILQLYLHIPVPFMDMEKAKRSSWATTFPVCSESKTLKMLLMTTSASHLLEM